MDFTEEREYIVELTSTSRRYFREVLDYVYQHHSSDRAEEIARELKEAAKSLKRNPNRGVVERRLKNRPQNYRFIIYKRTKRSDVKIIYYVDKSANMVYVTDFFPSDKDPEEIAFRS